MNIYVALYFVANKYFVLVVSMMVMDMMQICGKFINCSLIVSLPSPPVHKIESKV